MWLRDIWRSAAQSRGAAIIQVSTDYVFDGTAHIPYNEDEPTCPASVYGFTKLAGEQAVAEGCEKAVIIRTAWLYSIYGNNFVKTMMRLGREREQSWGCFRPSGNADLCQRSGICHLCYYK